MIELFSEFNLFEIIAIITLCYVVLAMMNKN
jgi:hypothetical protein